VNGKGEVDSVGNPSFEACAGSALILISAPCPLGNDGPSIFLKLNDAIGANLKESRQVNGRNRLCDRDGSMLRLQVFLVGALLIPGTLEIQAHSAKFEIDLSMFWCMQDS
jgi:hypothetical protein